MRGARVVRAPHVAVRALVVPGVLALCAVGTASAASDAPIGAVVSPPACLAEVVVQTTHLERVQSALVDVFRWRVVERTKSGGSREVLIGSATSVCGRVRLRAIAGRGAEPMRPGAHWWDRGGAYALNVFVHDAQATMAQFRTRGWVTAQPLEGYEEKRNGAVTAAGRFGRVIGPDDLVIGFQQRIAPPLQHWPEFEAASHVENVMEIVGDPRAWLDVAGAIVEPDGERAELERRLVARTVATSPLGGLLYGLPREFGAQADAQQAILRFGERGEQMLTAWAFTSIRGEDYSSRVDGAHAGIVALRVRVPDVERVERALRERGVEVVRHRADGRTPSRPREWLTAVAPGGSGLSFEIESPAAVRR